MKLIYILFALIFVNPFFCMTDADAATTSAELVRTSPARKRCVPTIRRVEFRKDLTRVYVTLSGIPHTSYRIDSVKMILPSGRSFEFTDIDGIDAKRYFQWEDSGEIEVEIDFPAMKKADRFQLEFDCPDDQNVIAVYKNKSGRK